MHAVVVRVNVSDRESATDNLRNRVVPGVSQLPGFVAGYWTQKDDGTGLSMVVFDSEENATSASETVQSRIPEGVELQDIEVREVVASA